MKRNKVILNWSSGKDCAMALHSIKQERQFEVVKLFSTINKNNNRVAMHAVPSTLLKKQAAAMGLPIELVPIEEGIGMQEYGDLIEEKMQANMKNEIFHSAFGDIALEDVKQYREEQLGKIGMQAIFPLWKQDTTAIIQNFIHLGFKAIVVAAAEKHFDKQFLGTPIDEEFLAKLPKEVDPCGENGEFHTFCFDGPIFDGEIDFKKGEIVSRKYSNPEEEGEIEYYYLSILPN